MTRPIGKKASVAAATPARAPTLETPEALAEHITVQLRKEPGELLTVEDVESFFRDGRPAPDDVRRELLEIVRAERDANHTTQRQKRANPIYDEEEKAAVRAAAAAAATPPTSAKPGADVDLPVGVLLQWMDQLAACIRYLPNAVDNFAFGEVPERSDAAYDWKFELEYGIALALGILVDLRGDDPEGVPEGVAEPPPTHRELLKMMADDIERSAEAWANHSEDVSVADFVHDVSLPLSAMVSELEEMHALGTLGSSAFQQGRAFAHTQMMDVILSALDSMVNTAEPNDDPLVVELRGYIEDDAGAQLVAMIEVTRALLTRPSDQVGDRLKQVMILLLKREQQLLAVLAGPPLLANPQ